MVKAAKDMWWEIVTGKPGKPNGEPAPNREQQRKSWIASVAEALDRADRANTVPCADALARIFFEASINTAASRLSRKLGIPFDEAYTALHVAGILEGK